MLTHDKYKYKHNKACTYSVIKYKFDLILVTMTEYILNSQFLKTQNHLTFHKNILYNCQEYSEIIY